MRAWPPVAEAPPRRVEAPPRRVEAPAYEPDEISELVEPSPTRSKVLLITVAATLLIAAMAMLGSWFLREHRAGANSAPQTALAASPTWKNSGQPMTLEDLRKRALEGDAVAQYAMGARYYHGDEVKQDYSEAVRWFSQAAEQGHVGAQTALGAYYWAGRGVAQDLGKAYYWSVLAREGGDQAARFRVTALASRMTKGQVQEAQQRANDWIRQHKGSPEE
jgi:TPR repeat protein